MITKLTSEKPASLIYCPSFNDVPLYEAVRKFSEGWPWMRDCCEWITREQATALQEAGQLKPEQSYWRVKHFGLICSDYGMTYTGTKDKLLQGISDFVEGWQTAVNHMKPTIEMGRLHRPWWNDDDRLATVKRPKQMKLGKITFRS